MEKNKYFGMVAEFSDPASLVAACKQIRESGVKKFDAYSPFPVHGIDPAIGISSSPLGWIVLCGGLTGVATGFLLQTWVATSAYKLVISGKPLLSYPAFMPVTFELGILFSAFAAVFGMFALNKLPQLYHAIFKVDRFKKVSTDGFFIGIEATDELFDEKKTKILLTKCGGNHITLVEA